MEEIIARLKATGELLAAEGATWTDAQWEWRPEDGGWSAREIVEHLILVERSLQVALRKILSEPARERTAPLTDEEVWRRLTAGGRKVEAPERVRPAGEWANRAEALAEFARRRAATVEYARTADVPWRERWFRIPVGELDGAQILLMLSGHLLRHLEQLRALRGRAGFPA